MKPILSFGKKHVLAIILTLFFLLAFSLRTYYLPSHLFFGPEQGIDFLAIREIALSHKLTLIGAKTDITGIFHGPLYYYLATIPFLLSRGDPFVVLSFLILIQCTSVFFIFLLGKRMFHPLVGLLAAFLFTISYGSIVYSRWLSAQPLAVPLSCCFFYFLYQYLKGKDKNLIFAAIFFALLTQVQFLNLFFFTCIMLISCLVFFQRFRRTKKIYLFTALLLAASLSLGNFLLFDLRHDFLISQSVKQLLLGKGYYESLDIFLLKLTGLLTTFLGWLYLPYHNTVALTLCIISLVALYLRKAKFYNKTATNVLFIWFFAPFLLLILLRHAVLDHYFIPLIPALLLTTSYLIFLICMKNALLGGTIISLVFLANTSSYAVNISKNTNMFFQSTQERLFLSDQKKVIDTIYTKANNIQFEVQTYTIPFWTQQGWEYLFWQYGLLKYGRLPVKEKGEKVYVIVQDDKGNRLYQEGWLRDTVSKWGEQKGEFRVGILTVKELIVQKR